MLSLYVCACYLFDLWQSEVSLSLVLRSNAQTRNIFIELFWSLLCWRGRIILNFLSFRLNITITCSVSKYFKVRKNNDVCVYLLTFDKMESFTFRSLLCWRVEFTWVFTPSQWMKVKSVFCRYVYHFHS